MECPICLEVIGAAACLGRIQECRHVYHDQCVLQWLAHSNLCPTCRKSFHGIDIVAFLTPDRIIRSVSVQDKLLGTDAINNIPAEFVNPPHIPHNIPSSELRDDALSLQTGVCLICSSAQISAQRTDIISCVGCGAKFHTSCLGHTEELHWFCPFCDCHQEFPISTMQVRTGARRGQRGDSRTALSLGIGRREGPSNGLGLAQRLAPIVDFPSADVALTNEPPISRRPTSSARNGQLVLSETPASSTFADSTEVFDIEEPHVTGPARRDTHLVGGGRSRSSVWNGGVLLRKQAKELRNLSPEERSSWSVLENARSGIETDVSNPVDLTGTTPQRKKRRARAPSSNPDPLSKSESLGVALATAHNAVQSQALIQNIEGIVSYDAGLSANAPGNLLESPIMISGEAPGPRNATARPSRISSLMSQIRNRSANLYVAQSPTNGSSLSAQSIGTSASYGPQISSYEGLIANSDSRLSSPAVSSPGSTVAEVEEAWKPRALTLDEKLKVQAHVRTYLRPLYHSEDPAIRKISTEDDYIRINKGVSRQVYSHISDLCSARGPEVYGNIFEGDQSELREMVNKYVWGWTQKRE